MAHPPMPTITKAKKSISVFETIGNYQTALLLRASAVA